MKQATPVGRPREAMNRRGSLSWRKRLVFALLPACLLWAVSELALRGVGFHYNPHDLNSPLFETDGAGSVRTSWIFTDPKNVRAFNFEAPVSLCRRQTFTRGKRPEVLRIALLGGSSVWLLDKAEGLHERLELDLQRPVEMINMGIMGCGSGRVLLSAHEAINLDVDVLMVYTGHNEFHDFTNPVIYKKIPFGLRQPVRSSRTMQMIWWIADRLRPRNSWSGDAQVEALTAMSNQRLLSPAEREVIYKNFQTNLEHLARLAQRQNKFLVWGTVASNLNAPPGHPELRQQLLNMSDLSSADIRELAIKPNADWASCYRYGLLLKGEGKPALAREYLEQSLLRSPEPGRANRRINDILRHTSIEHGVALADVESHVNARDPDNLPGELYFRDPMHMKPLGNEILLDTYYDVFRNHLGRLKSTQP